MDRGIAAEQRRCVREVSASSLFTSLAADGSEGAAGDAGGAGTGEGAAGDRTPRSPLDRRAPSLACSTPIARD